MEQHRLASTAKAIAEMPIDSPASAITNAVFQATGVREIPLTPDRVLKALQAAERGSE